MTIQRASVIACTAGLAVAELARVAIRLVQHRDISAEFHCWVIYFAVSVCVYAFLTRPDHGETHVHHHNTWTTTHVRQEGDGPDPKGDRAGTV